MWKTTPQEGYITCDLGNLTVEERYELHICCLGNKLFIALLSSQEYTFKAGSTVT